MSYVRAEDVLPKELIETIQQYVNGKCVYIPCKEKKVWGSQTKTREYSLSEKSIQRIIRTNEHVYQTVCI